MSEPFNIHKIDLLSQNKLIIFSTFWHTPYIGRRWRVTAPPRFKPWNSPHRYDNDEEDREFWEEQDEAMKDKYQNGRYGKTVKLRTNENQRLKR